MVGLVEVATVIGKLVAIIINERMKWTLFEHALLLTTFSFFPVIKEGWGQ